MKRNIIAFCIFCLCTGSLAACNDFDNPRSRQTRRLKLPRPPFRPPSTRRGIWYRCPTREGRIPASSSTRTRNTMPSSPVRWAGTAATACSPRHCRRPCLLVVQRQFLRRGGRQDPRPGQLQLPAQQPDDPERGDDRLRTGERRRPGMAGRLRADGQPLGRTLLPGPHPHPPSESLPLRCRDPERRNRPGLLLLGRRCRRI